MPDFEKRRASFDATALSETLTPVVKDQMREFVLRISSLYRQSVPFHNFEHASHVESMRSFVLIILNIWMDH